MTWFHVESIGLPIYGEQLHGPRELITSETESAQPDEKVPTASQICNNNEKKQTEKTRNGVLYKYVLTILGF